MTHVTKKFRFSADALSIMGTIVAAYTLSVFGLVSAAQAAPLPGPNFSDGFTTFSAPFEFIVVPGSGAPDLKEFRYMITENAKEPAGVLTCQNGTVLANQNDPNGFGRLMFPPIITPRTTRNMVTSTISVISCSTIPGNDSPVAWVWFEYQVGQLTAPTILPASKSFNATLTPVVTQGAGSVTSEFKEFRYTKNSTTTPPAAPANCTSGTAVPSNGQISIKETTSVSVIACGKTTGNKSSATTATYTLDKTAPTVGVTGPFASDGTTPLALANNVSTITYKMTFVGADTIPSNSVLASKITLKGSSVASIAVTGSGDTERILTLNNVTGDGSATVIVVASGAASDSAGNSSSVTGKTFVLDNTAPSATSISINKAAAYTNSTAATLTLAATGASKMYITNTAGCSSNGSYEDYATAKSWTLGQTNGTATVYVKFKDAAGNESDCINDTIIHDNTLPTFTVSGPSQAYANPSSIVTYTVTYTGATRAITLAPTDITLNSSNHAQGKFASAAIKVTPDPGVGCNPGPCTVVPDPMKKLVTLSGFKNNGTLGISIAAKSASDWAGNFAAAGTQDSATVIVDTGIPTITVGNPSLATARDASTVTYTITYNGVTAVTLDNSHVTLKKTGTANAIFDVSGTGTSGTVTRTVTLSSFTGKGDITIQILKDTASDDAGNKAPAPRAVKAFKVDAAIPTIFVGNPSIADAKADSTVTYDVSYTRVSNVTLANSDVLLIKTGTANATYNVTSEQGSGSGTTRTEIRRVTLSGFTGDGTIKIKILRGTASDHVGVFATETTAEKTFTVDNTAPSAPILTASKDFNKAFIAKISKATAADASFKEIRYVTALGTSATAPDNCASGTMLASGGSVAITAATTTVAAIACDRAGNKSLPTTATYTLDLTPPTIAVSAPSVTEATPATVAVTYTVTYSGADKITLSSANIKREYTGSAWTNLAPTVSMDTALPPDPMKRIVTLKSFRGTGTLGISIAPGTAVDNVGNKASQLSPSVSPTFIVSSTTSGTGPATITAISLALPTGTGRSGAETVLSFTVTTSKAITSGLTAQTKLPFKIGTTEKLAVYASGSGTSSLTFNYTTASGDNGLVAWAAGQLRGGSLGAGTGVELNPTFTLGTTSRTIDTTPPADPTVTANQTFTSGIKATISESTIASDAKEFRYALDQISTLNCSATAEAVNISAIPSPPPTRSKPAELEIPISGSFSPLRAIICDTTGNASGIVSRSYTYVVPTPTVTSILPNTGTTAGGTTVTLTGTNLTGATAVTIGGIAATNVIVVNATTITAITSAGGTAGAASVLVTTPGGTNPANTLFLRTIPTPTVTSILPNTGTTAGGTTVTLTGTNLTGATAVTIGGIAATNVTVVSATTITAITAAGGTAGAASVLVTTPGGTNAANTLFTWTTPTPTSTGANLVYLQRSYSWYSDFGNLSLQSGDGTEALPITGHVGKGNFLDFLVTESGTLNYRLTASMSSNDLGVLTRLRPQTSTSITVTQSTQIATSNWQPTANVTGTTPVEVGDIIRIYQGFDYYGDGSQGGNLDRFIINSLYVSATATKNKFIEFYSLNSGYQTPSSARSGLGTLASPISGYAGLQNALRFMITETGTLHYDLTASMGGWDIGYLKKVVLSTNTTTPIAGAPGPTTNVTGTTSVVEGDVIEVSHYFDNDGNGGGSNRFNINSMYVTPSTTATSSSSSTGGSSGSSSGGYDMGSSSSGSSSGGMGSSSSSSSSSSTSTGGSSSSSSTGGTSSTAAPSNFVVTTTSTDVCQDDCWIRNHTFSWTAPSGNNSTLLHYEVSTPVAPLNWFIRYNYRTGYYEFNMSPEDHLYLRVLPPSQTTHFNSSTTSTSNFRLRAVYGYRIEDPDCDGLCREVPTSYSDYVYPTSPSGSSLFIDTTPAAIKSFGGLMWSNKRPNATLQGAKDHCNTLNYGGVTGWRLPTVDELIAAYGNGIYGTANVNWMTTSQMNDYFWSPRANNIYGYAFLVNLANGVSTSLFELIPNAVVCVK